MRKVVTIALLLFGIFVLGGEVKAQSVVRSQVPVSTNVNDGRFEFIRSTEFLEKTFLLDKYTGKVWRRTGRGTLEQLPVEGLAHVEAERICFQLYMDNSVANDCFLLNIHTGELWEYHIEKLTNRMFRRLEMPAELKIE